MECIRIAAREVDLAGKADSLEHMAMHLETALIWLRNVDPERVRAFFADRRPTTAAVASEEGL